MPGRTMPFLLYCAVTAIAAGGVVFGLDWQSAPMSPMPETMAAAAAPPAPAAAETPDTALRRAYPGAPDGSPPVGADPGPDAQAAKPAEAAPPACNVDACTRAYRSFSASDCTYQPIGGPRRLCKK